MHASEVISTPVTGAGYIGDTRFPEQALAQFYKAFNSQDIMLMRQNWEESADIVMDNPLGGIKRGWDEIRGVYEKVFASKSPIRVEFCEYTMHQFAEIFYVVGRERALGGRSEPPIAIRTSRIFHRQPNGEWKLVHHHGSFDDPKLLEKYQAAVV